ncbi:hypothetical protein CH267_06775 [Rhodococcus sp. 06-621-2]|nr:hypothetical protein [Rhodococcus sp. 06-621-2]OZC59786.1 hypothetical protein CH267_06775 [Rhodococcus sp. 06-621-2]
MSKVRTALAGCAIAAGALLVQAPAADAAVVGGVDVAGYCSSMVGATYLSGTRVNAADAYSWQCTYAGVPWRGVDMNAACRRQYSNSYATVLDRRSAYSWRCNR